MRRRQRRLSRLSLQFLPAGGGSEVRLLHCRQLERLSQQVQRANLWGLVHTPLQRANGFATQPGMLGERFLGEASQDTVLPQQCPKGTWVRVGHRVFRLPLGATARRAAVLVVD